MDLFRTALSSFSFSSCLLNFLPLFPLESLLFPELFVQLAENGTFYPQGSWSEDLIKISVGKKCNGG